MKNKWFLVLIIGVILWGIMYKTPIFVMDNFIYEPSVHFSDMDIYTYGKIGERPVFFSVIPHQIEKRLLLHPYVKSVKVTKKLPDTLVLDIEYRQEFAAILYSGLYVTIDDQMTVLKVEESIGDIFLVDGFEFEAFQIGEQLQVKRKEVLKHIIQLIYLLQNSHIESKPYMRYDNGIEVLINDGYRVLFGKGNDIENKFNDFVSIYERLSETGVNSGTIDLGHDGPPVYRPFGE